MPDTYAEERNRVFPEQRDVVACYRHEEFKASPDSVIDDLPSPVRVLGPDSGTVRRMAATRTRDIFRTGHSKVAIDPGVAAILGHRKCGPLGGSAMITLSIFGRSCWRCSLPTSSALTKGNNRNAYKISEEIAQVVPRAPAPAQSNAGAEHVDL